MLGEDESEVGLVEGSTRWRSVEGSKGSAEDLFDAS